MTDEKWQQLVDVAELQFSNVEVKTGELITDTPDGPVKQGTVNILIFENSAGRFKLVRENRPVVLQKKQHYSHRPGDTARIEYKHSDTEFSHKLKVYKEVGYEEWREITLDSLGLR